MSPQTLVWYWLGCLATGAHLVPKFETKHYTYPCIWSQHAVSCRYSLLTGKSVSQRWSCWVFVLRRFQHPLAPTFKTERRVSCWITSYIYPATHKHQTLSVVQLRVENVVLSIILQLFFLHAASPTNIRRRVVLCWIFYLFGCFLHSVRHANQKLNSCYH